MKDIYRMVKKLRQTHKTDNPFNICINLGITVSISELPYYLRGFFITVGREKLIIINEGLTVNDRLFECARQLCLILQNRLDNSLVFKESELMFKLRLKRESEYFASALLSERFRNADKSRQRDFFGLG